MAEIFTLSGKQWRIGLALCAIVAPLLMSVPLSIAMLAGDQQAPFWRNLPSVLVMGAVSALAFVGLPALLLGAAALALAQRAIRIHGVVRARPKILAIGEILGAATGAPYAIGIGHSLVALILLAIGALSGLGVAAYCMRLLRRLPLA